MTEKAKRLGNEPAFPQAGLHIEGGLYRVETAGMSLDDVVGLTKREYFAGLAMQGIVSDINVKLDEKGCISVAKMSLNCVDALLEELSK